MAETPRLGVAEIGLCLDFVNTEGVERNSPPDRLASAELFLEWATGRALLDAEQAGALLEQALENERATALFLTQARELREAMYRIFSTQAAGGLPAEADRAIVDRHLAAALPNLRLGKRDERFGWLLADPPSRPAELLWPIALSAADLLCSAELGRVKECSGETCSWMFIDQSRNRSRRWCDMADCGNRAKARRFYRRHASRS